MHTPTCTPTPKSPLGFTSAFGAEPVTPKQILAFHAAQFGSLRMSNDDQAAKGGDGGQGAGDSGGSGEPAADKGGSGTGAGDDAGDESKLGDAGKRALQSERAARTAAEQKSAAVEKKFDDLIGGLKTALGVDSKENDATAIVTGLQEQLTKLQHQNLVSEVARRHSITEDDDIDLLRSATDKDVMEKLAGRLTPSSEGEGAGASNGANGKPRPKPDPSQGKGGGAKPNSVAQVMAERAAARAKK